ncbi:protein Wiz isoform X2 [Clupea harengus]|uniref:Protein Wiz isoform X2 n=1 Tax=Clupea harengus TaxID=7950 RepID=A0A6P8FQG8_CLUHA|nr:protein Wiz isoform X2 [Clupea harengus]
MESGGGAHPSGDQCTLGTNQGSLPSVSAQDSTSPPPLNRTLQGSSSSDEKEEFPCGVHLLNKNGDRDLEGTQGTQGLLLSTVGSGRNAQRSSKSSAFPSSLTWDSDSEKETQDEEELQHFCNPYGLVAHSPGSPTSGCEPDRSVQEGCQTPEKPKHALPEKDLLIPLQDQAVNTQKEGSMRILSTEPKLSDAEAGNVSREKETFLPKAKPKGGCHKEEAKDDKQKARDVGPEMDVYSFPGDSDPESPPPAQWAHCTFVERRRKKRALLRPFSGLGSWQRTVPGSSRKSRVTTLRPKECGTVVSNSGVFDFKEELEEDEEDEGNEEEDEEEEDAPDGKEKMPESETPQEPNQDICPEIFTCVECSIYFKKQCHLRDHMREHSQKEGRGGKGTGSRRGKAARFECKECGQVLEDRLALTNHQRRHRESRCKILEEISKLNEGGKKAGERSGRGRVTEPKGKKPTPICHQFVCLKCNFSTDIPQELADHAKAHAPRKRAGMLRCSPRLQPKLSSAEKIQSPGTRPSGLATALSCDQHSMQESSSPGICEHLCPAHSSQTSTTEVERQKELGPCAESGGLDLAVTPQVLSDSLEEHTVPRQTPPQAGLSQEVASAPVGSDAAVEDCSHQVNSVETQPENPKEPAPPKREVAFKSIGNRRSARESKGSSRPVRSFAREDNASEKGDQEQSQVEIKDQPLKKTQNVPEASAVSSGDNSKDGPSTQQHPIAPSSPKQRTLKEEPDKETTHSMEKTTGIKLENEKEDDGNDAEDDDDVERFLTEPLSDDDEDEGLMKNVERKCPYCPECFHNGIGLANHVRGHLNRVGVSYNVRHFISPEEVNAIETKFSYQKKRKKVANFDPDTFSVMRCEFCSAGFDTRAGLSSHARAHLRDFGITNWEVTVSPIHILRELFSSRPDLVLPTAPPRTPTSGEEMDPDLDSEADQPGSAGHKREEDNDVPKQSSPLPWKIHSACDREGEEQQQQKEDDDEDDEDEMPVLDGMPPSPAETRLSPLESENHSSREDTGSKGVLKCKVCGAPFETRRGLSSHARSHLRQLGVGMSESSGAPIDLLYQIAKERSLPHSPPPQPKRPSRNVSSPSPPRQREQERCEDEEDEEEEDLDVKPPVLTSAVQPPPSPSIPSLAGSLPPSPFVRSRSPSRSPSPVLRKAPISSLLPVSSPLRSLDGRGGLGKTISAPPLPPSKPYWAPQETDAPLNLTMEPDPNKDIVCQLCGAWFETRKGLSSHARAHLRHFGVEYSESKGSPIDLLNRLILTDDFKRRVAGLSPSAGIEDLRSLVSLSSSSSPPSSSKRPLLPNSSASPLLFKASAAGSKTTSSLFGPPRKKPRASPQQVFRLSGGQLTPYSQAEPLKDVGCEFCGEYFENRKGLSSHARSHLRQMGITEWSVNGSPIDTLREIITRRGLPCALPPRPLKSPPSTPGPGPPRVALSSHPPSSTSSASPPGALLRRLPFPFTHPPGQHQPTARRMEVSASASRASASPATHSSAAPLKPKPEPIQLEVTLPGTTVDGGEGGAGGFTMELLGPSWASSDSLHPISRGLTHDSEPTRDIRCEFCGEYFENRKGLSSHARSHLRQMGITEWSVNGSPIDTLREIMRKQQGGSYSSLATLPSSSPSGGVKKEPRPGGSPTWDGLSQQPSKFSRKHPLNMLHSGSRLHKHGMGLAGMSTTPPAGKFFTVVSPQGKRPPGEEGRPAERMSNQGPQPKAFSPVPHDFSLKGKASPDKHGVGHLDASCELCGFYFENRKALASHARAHLRQFGVTEWSVNGSPIETLSAWMRSRPHKVAEMHRGYMQGGRSGTKKRGSSSLSPASDSGHTSPISQKPSSALWASLSQSRNRANEVAGGQWGSSRSTEVRAENRSSQHGHTHQVSSSAPPHAQVARSELNVRLPRGFERRPLKHPSHPDAGERETGPPKPPRTSTVPALVPKPPSTPLVKVVGKIYSLKCRFCEVEFHGPLSVQEDWIRHLQQHILNLNYAKPATPSTTPDPSAATKSTPETPTSSAPVSLTTSAPASIATATLTLTPNPTPTATAPPTPVQTPTATPTPSSPRTPTPTAMGSTLTPCTAAKPLPSPAT